MTDRPDYTQIGYPDANGVMLWQEREPIRLDTLSNLKRRWRAAGTYEKHNITEIPGGIEVDAYISNSELAGWRQRLVWGQQ